MQWWNPFLSFCVLVIIAGVLFELLNIWRLYAERPKCRCPHITQEKNS